ncbi:MAG: hypothetical protein ACLR2G_04965 [Phascolarctobacterium faecium]
MQAVRAGDPSADGSSRSAGVFGNPVAAPNVVEKSLTIYGVFGHAFPNRERSPFLTVPGTAGSW